MQIEVEEHRRGNASVLIIYVDGKARGQIEAANEEEATEWLKILKSHNSSIRT